MTHWERHRYCVQQDAMDANMYIESVTVAEFSRAQRMREQSANNGTATTGGRHPAANATYMF